MADIKKLKEIENYSKKHVVPAFARLSRRVVLDTISDDKSCKETTMPGNNHDPLAPKVKQMDFSRFTKDVSKNMQDEISKSFYSGAIASEHDNQKTQPLTIEKFVEIHNEMKRKANHIIIMEQPYLPDDCYGVLMLRPEDAKKWRKARSTK